MPITTLLSLVWTLQLVVYVAQENAELRALGVHQPVLNVISGVHLWAAGAHLLVAGALLAVLWLVHRPVAQLAELVREVVAWLLAHPGRRLAPARRAPAVRSWTPVERFGRQLWSRPPPAALQGVVHGVGRLRGGTLSESAFPVPQRTAKYCADSSSSHAFSFRRARFMIRTTMLRDPILILSGTNRPNSHALKVARVLERK